MPKRLKMDRYDEENGFIWQKFPHEITKCDKKQQIDKIIRIKKITEAIDIGSTINH